MIKKLLIIFGILFITTSANAQVKWQKYSYFQNWSGLNDNVSSTEIKDSEASAIQNVTFDTGGAIKKRYGYVTVPNNPVLPVATGATASCVNGITFLKLNSGTRFLVAMVNQGTQALLYEQPYGIGGGVNNVAWINISNNGFSSSYTNNIQPSFTVASNGVVVCDGTNNYPYFWNGSGTAQLLTSDANLPQGKICLFHKNILFVANSTTNPSRIWFSNLGIISTWTLTDFFDVQASDGEQVRGMVSTFNCLYIFKDHSIWCLAGTNRDDFVLQKMVDGIGTLSNSSIQVVNNYIYFTTAQNDVAIYDGAYTVQFISQKIRGTIGGLSFNRASNTCGVAFSTYKYNDYDYYCSVTNSPGSTNNLILLFDTAYKAWTKFVGLNANCMTVGDNSNIQNTLYFGDYSGYVHEYPSTSYYDGNVATSPIVAFYQTKWFRYPEVGLGDKYWRLLKTYCASEAENSVLTITASADFGNTSKVYTDTISTSGSMWDTALWDINQWAGVNTILIDREEVNEGTNMFQINYSNGNLNQGFTLLGFENFIEGSEQI